MLKSVVRIYHLLFSLKYFLQMLLKMQNYEVKETWNMQKSKDLCLRSCYLLRHKHYYTILQVGSFLP